ncbi:MAG: SEC-C domain-containing protein [Sedimentisphaerales bacterium]|nr:SEC-C domain-containing protein [Sedimentisphaerales bacterium]
MAVTEYIGKTLLKIFSSSSDRYVKKRHDFVAYINELEEEYSRLTDSQLHGKTNEFRRQIQELEERIIGPDLRKTLRDIQLLPEEARRPAKKRLTEQLRQCCDGILAEAFATVREISDRHLGMRNVFDKQLNFDPSIFSPEMRSIYDDVEERVNVKEEDVHRIELPPRFYEEIRRHYDASKRPPFRFRHFDVQMIGGGVLYEGKIAEMATGEGKTLVATLSTYMVALSGRKVHIITVNDYLAQRDRDWMGPVFEALGLTVGAIQSGMDTAGPVRRAQYSCDITYGTNNEFGFDYLRDNMKVRAEDQVQGPLDFTIIDEVDSILIDEARTPLIISGPAQDDTSRYQKADIIARELIQMQRNYSNMEKQIDQIKRDMAATQGEINEIKKTKDDKRLAKAQNKLKQLEPQLTESEARLAGMTQYYEVEYDRHSVHLTHDGIGAAQDKAGVGSFYVGSNMEWPHLMEQALRAHLVFEKEKEYVVQDGEVIIVDEFTGRLMHGRQWSDGLHQAVEAKENVHVKEESQTLATITIQNFFKLYQQLSGMTGTAITEAEEFAKIYQLDVLKIPTNKPVVRDDKEDLVYKTLPEKFQAIVEEIYAVSCAGRPVLIGTISIEKNEELSAALTQRYNLDHEILNARQHAREAAIIAKAGHQHQRRDGMMCGNITIATNMAGRGTDIKLGPGVLEAGGLHVLGTERHEARRIDNQLRGRCGRQGDPGSSQFFLSLDDDLFRFFGDGLLFNTLRRVFLEDGEPIYMKRLSKAIEKIQLKVEQRNFEIRKSLLEYDEVMDYQRQVFYTRRQSILEGIGLEGLIWEMIDETIGEVCQKMLSRDYPYECVAEWARTMMGVDIELDRIRGDDAGEVEHTLRVHAHNNAEQDIDRTLGEYMSYDLEPEEWDLKGLSKWAMTRFGVNISQNQLKKMAPEEVQEQLVEAANQRVDKFDCTRIVLLLDEEFALKSLYEWFTLKFGIDVDMEELKKQNRDQIDEFLLNQARKAYRRREIEYPVDFILNVALRQQQQGSRYAAEEVVDWAKRKFNIDLSIEEVQTSSFDKIRKRLLDLSASYNDGELEQEIDSRLDQCRWDEPDKESLVQWARDRFDVTLHPDEMEEENTRDIIQNGAHQFLRRELTELERYVLLQIYDSTWKDHLYAMDHLKGSVGLRGYAEKDPRMEYKREGFRMFQEMLSTIRDKVTDIIFKAKLAGSAEMRSVWNISSTMHNEYSQFEAQQEAAQRPQAEAKPATIKLEKPKVGRNEPCPCGSGKKYKKCCGRGS